MDVIYYNRISTDNKDQDPKSNLSTSEDFCKKNNHNIIDTIIDEGISGSVPYYERKEGNKIRRYADLYESKGKELGIVVFSIDRFSREHPVRAMTHLEDLKDKGVTVFSATEMIFQENNEFTLPMQFNILWFNYYFLIQHSKKVKAGNKKRLEEGKHLGRNLIKRIKGTGKNKEIIYYTEEEKLEIYKRVKFLSKKNSYRKIIEIMAKDDVKLSLGYITKILKK